MKLNKFKPILYIIIILFSIFLIITIARPFIAGVYWHSAVIEVGRRNWDKAIEIYQVALSWSPHEGSIHYALGKVYIVKGDYDKALKHIKEVEKYLDYPSIPQNLAVIYLAQGDWDNAIIELKRAISYQKREDMMPPLYYTLASIYFKQSEIREGLTALKRAVELAPDDEKAEDARELIKRIEDLKK